MRRARVSYIYHDVKSNVTVARSRLERLSLSRDARRNFCSVRPVQLLHADLRQDDLVEPLHRGRFPLVRHGKLGRSQEREVLDVLHPEARVECLEKTAVLVVGKAELGPDARVHEEDARVFYSETEVTTEHGVLL